MITEEDIRIVSSEIDLLFKKHNCIEEEIIGFLSILLGIKMADFKLNEEVVDEIFGEIKAAYCAIKILNS